MCHENTSTLVKHVDVEGRGGIARLLNCKKRRLQIGPAFPLGVLSCKVEVSRVDPPCLGRVRSTHDPSRGGATSNRHRLKVLTRIDLGCVHEGKDGGDSLKVPLHALGKNRRLWCSRRFSNTARGLCRRHLHVRASTGQRTRSLLTRALTVGLPTCTWCLRLTLRSLPTSELTMLLTLRRPARARAWLLAVRLSTRTLPWLRTLRRARSRRRSCGLSPRCARSAVRRSGSHRGGGVRRGISRR